MPDSTKDILEHVYADLNDLYTARITVTGKPPTPFEVKIILAGLLDQEVMLTPEELADRIKVNPRTVLASDIPRHTFGPQTIRYLWSEVQAYGRRESKNP